MILKGACNDGRLAHNGSFIVILALGDEEVGIKLQWGDFGEPDVPDMRIETDPETAALLRSVGWTVQPENKISGWNGQPYPVNNVATVPTGTEVFVLGEKDSYWKVEENGGMLKSTGKPSDDKHSRSGYRHFLPEETVVFVAEYVRAFARGIWKDGVYTPFPYESERPPAPGLAQAPDGTRSSGARVIRIVINEKGGYGFELSAMAQARLKMLGLDTSASSGFERHDPRLVAIVEDMGSLASGKSAYLVVTTIVSSEYIIEEHDGYERVITTNSPGWVKADIEKMALIAQKASTHPIEGKDIPLEERLKNIREAIVEAATRKAPASDLLYLAERLGHFSNHKEGE